MNHIFKYALMFAFVGIAMFALSQMSDHAKAADVVWDGGGADNLASTKENWIGDVAPATWDNMIFDTTSSKNASLNVPNHSVTVENGYNGFITATTNQNGEWNISAGTIIIDVFQITATFTQWNGNIILNQVLQADNDFISHSGTITGNDLYLIYDNIYIYDTIVSNSFIVPDINGNVIVGNNANVKIDSNMILNNFILNGTLTQHSVFSQIENSLILNGQWTGNIYYNGTSDISTDQQHWTGWLYTQNDIAIKYNAYAYLAFQHDTWLGIQMRSWSGTDNFTWNATSVASQTVQWSWSRGESSAMYDEYQDGIYIGSCETNAGGMGTFTNTFSGTHAFLLSRSTFLPASTDISDDVWLGIIFMSIATLITLFGYVRHIGLVMIISFLLLVIGTLASTQIWVELWTLPTLFILVNAVLMTHGLLRKV